MKFIMSPHKDTPLPFALTICKKSNGQLVSNDLEYAIDLFK